MTIVNAYAATEKNGTLKPFQYELGEIGDYEIDIDVKHCGICHNFSLKFDDLRTKLILNK